jgi:predicted RNase H-like HicB family nuclease
MGPASPAGRRKVIDRPFDRKILRQAILLAQQYRLILEPESELGYVGHAIEMPNVFADGATPDACVRNTQQALTAAIATMIEAGLRPPAPVQSRRRFQMNVRLNAEEKLLLQERARQAGFRSLSDYVRAAALTQAMGSRSTSTPGKRRKTG